MDGPAFEYEDLEALFIVTSLRRPSGAEFGAHVRAMTARHQRPGRFAMVMDVAKAPPPTPQHRRVQDRWLAEHHVLIANKCFGVAFIFSSPAARFVLSTMLLLRPLPCPYAVCDSRAQALGRAEAWLRAAGIVPAWSRDRSLSSRPP
ncbi:MAG TPA: hypothetical protein VFS43_26510 [Polyangiaceae bacterium]|nr:hypothetical protein [Polyangiaceae bacterium]